MTKVKISVYSEKRDSKDWRVLIPDLMNIKEIELDCNDIIRIKKDIVSVIYLQNGNCIASPMKKEEIMELLTEKSK